MEAWNLSIEAVVADKAIVEATEMLLKSEIDEILEFELAVAVQLKRCCSRVRTTALLEWLHELILSNERQRLGLNGTRNLDRRSAGKSTLALGLGSMLAEKLSMANSDQRIHAVLLEIVSAQIALYTVLAALPCSDACLAAVIVSSLREKIDVSGRGYRVVTIKQHASKEKLISFTVRPVK